MSIRRVIFASSQNLKLPFLCQYLIFFNDFLFYIRDFIWIITLTKKSKFDLKVYGNLKTIQIRVVEASIIQFNSFNAIKLKTLAYGFTSIPKPQLLSI